MAVKPSLPYPQQDGGWGDFLGGNHIGGGDAGETKWEAVPGTYKEVAFLC